MCDVLMLKVEEAARRLGLGRSMTYSLIARGDLRSIKIGAARRILVSDLEDFARKIGDEDGAGLR